MSARISPVRSVAGSCSIPSRCGRSYLATEAQSGTPPDQVQKVTKEFDYTRQNVLAAVVKDDTYCTEGRNREVKAALTRYLAGEFNPPQRQQALDVKWNEHQAKRETFKGEDVFDRAQRPRQQD